MSEEMKTQSLDDTLKELLNEDTKSEISATSRPKRTRRTKAQIEADKKAAESKDEKLEESASSKCEDSIKNAEEKNSETKPTSSVGNVDFAGDPIIFINVNAPQVIPVDENAELSNVETTPEVIFDTDQDILPDVEDSSESTEVDGTVEEKLEPELVIDTPIDNLPDVEEPKKPAPQRKVYPSGEAIEALNGTSNKKKSKYVGKSLVLTDLTPMFRAPHYSMRIKPYRGLVTVIEDPKGDFIKVQYLRQGFGMCSSYMESYHFTSPKEGDNNVSEETCPC